MSLSIRWRLAIGIIVAFVITLVVVLLTARVFLERSLTSDLDSRLSSNVDRVLAQVILAGTGSEALQEIVDQNSLTTTSDSPFITVIRDLDGEVLAAPSGVDATVLDLSQERLDEVRRGGSFSSEAELVGGQEFRVRTAPLIVNGEVTGIVQAGETTAGTTGPLDNLELILLLEGLAGAAAALLLGYWLARGAVKPLQDVVEVAAEIEASDLHRRIGARDRPAEVQRLSDTFDAMLERLDKAFQAQRNFLYDASHELRTPLTVLRGNIDVLLMDDRLDQDTRDQLERMGAEAERLTRLTNNLLYMASAEAGREVERRPVELDVLCLEVFRQTQHLRRDVVVQLGKEDQVTVLGERDLLKQLILNLVENGIKYVPAGGKVTVSVSKTNGDAEVAVEDNGPGIDPETLPHIFQRFYRGDNRAGGGVRGGIGLGLAIADWIARSHGGRIDVESEVGRGSTFRFILPVGQGTGEAAPEPSVVPSS
jgi:signal transduction histidine kinase